ncbi:MAG TPA: carboxymuconolactone decarboxylase family protein [Miltoncostaeales bacterium]|nr:carboxymuconolactone decarboxylase family protein [Miltoncostaeales bacterium]
MKRYELVGYDEASPATRLIYDDYLRSTGSIEVPYWLQSLGATPDLLSAYWERTKGSLLHGSLPMILKEMVIFVVSVENGSRYCSACHAHAVLSLDPSLKFDQLMSLTVPGDASAGLPPSYRAALDFAVAAAQNANGLDDAAFERLHEADFSDEEVLELLSLVNLAVMFNSYTSTARLPLDPDYRPVLDEV